MTKAKRTFSAKRALAIALALVMALSVMPMTLAADDLPAYLNESGQVVEQTGYWQSDTTAAWLFFSTDLSVNNTGNSREGLNNPNGTMNYTYVRMQDSDAQIDLKFAYGSQEYYAWNNRTTEGVVKSGEYWMNGISPMTVDWVQILDNGQKTNGPFDHNMADNLAQWEGTMHMPVPEKGAYTGSFGVNFQCRHSAVHKWETDGYHDLQIINLTVIDKRDLLGTIREAYAVKADQNRYEDHSFAAFLAALQAAEAIGPAATVVTQAQVDAADQALRGAIDGLELRKADDTELRALKDAIAQAQPIVADPAAAEQYTGETLAELTAKYNAAVALLESEPDVGQQEQINETAQALLDAISALEKFADYSLVEQAVLSFYRLNEAYFNAADYAAVKAQVAAAEAELEQKRSETQQAQVDALADSLLDAIAGLALLPADYTAYDAAIAEAERILTEDAEKYTPESMDALWDLVLADFDRGLTIDKQDVVASAAQAIRDAIAGLERVVVDKTALQEKIAEAKGYTDAENYTDYYTSGSRAALDTALADAQAVFKDPEATAGQVRTAANKLSAAIVGLTVAPADYSALNDAIAKRTAELEAARTAVTESGKAIYKAVSLAQLEAALEMAREVVGDQYTKADQDLVNAAAASLHAVVLEKNPADYAALNALIKAKTADYNNADPALHTADSIAALKAALDVAEEAVAANYTVEQQQMVDDACAALNAVQLAYQGADCTGLEEWIGKAEEIRNDPDSETRYSDAYLEELENALNEAKDLLDQDLNINDQETIDNAANDLKAIVDKAGDDDVLQRADTAELEAALQDAKEKLTADDIGSYTAESVQALKDAVAQAEAMLQNPPSVDNAAEVDAMVDALNDAVNGLEIRKADKTALSDAIADAMTRLDEAKASGRYTEDSLAAFQAIIDEAMALYNQELTFEHEAEITAMIGRLANADSVLVYQPADLGALDQAISNAQNKIGSADYPNYSEASRAAYEALLGEAVALRGAAPDITRQAEVEAMADRLNNFKFSLSPADYTALDALIAQVEGMQNLEDQYTKASIAALNDALREAKAFDRELDKEDQAMVDNAAAKLQSAIDALEAYTKVTSVDITTAADGKDVEGQVLYVKVPWTKTYKSQSVVIGIRTNAGADIQSVTWEYANWSVDKPEATITGNGGNTAVIRPNGKGIGARSCWVKVTVTDVNGNTATDTIKVRFYNWSWQIK